MSETLKHYFTTEPYNITGSETLLDNVIPISKLLEILKTQTRPTSFAHPTVDPKPISQKPQGFITLKSIFDPSETHNDFNSFPEEYVDDIEDFLDRYGSWELDPDDIQFDNTYNYASPIETEIRTESITITNPDSEAFESKDLLLMSPCISLDVRDAYLPFVIAIFDNQTGDNYDLQEFGIQNFNIVTGSFNYCNESYLFDIDTQICSPTCQLTLTLDSDAKNIANELNDVFEITIDPSDKNDIKTEIESILHDFDHKSDTIHNLTIEYNSEPIE